MKNIKRIGFVIKNIMKIGFFGLGFMMVAGISYDIGSAQQTFEVNGTQKNYKLLNEFYEEKMMMVATLTEQVSYLDSEIVELGETKNSKTEAIEFGASIKDENRIEELEEQLAEQEDANITDLEVRKNEVNAQIQNVQGQIEAAQQEIDRMQSQIEAWGN